MKKQFLDYDKSLELVDLLAIEPLGSCRVALNDSLGRVLAEDIVAPRSEPAHPTASMDGYAICFEDQSLGRLRILGDNPAGNDEQRTLKRGECIKTFTGSKMPKGADTLIPIENVKCEGAYIHIEQSVERGFAVRAVAESFAAGDRLIKKGSKIDFVQIGVMASLGKVMVDVAISPRVAVLATGDEILDLGECSDNEATIYSSNNYTIAALCQSAGAQVYQMGTVGDSKEAILDAFSNAVASSELVISTGGVSVGDYDFVRDIIPALGFEIIFQGVGIKPGRHTLLARKGKKYILALPGFAYSSTVTAILYALPIISRLLGAARPPYRVVEAVLDEDFTKRTPFREFRACNLRVEGGKFRCDFKGKKQGSSAMLVNLLGGSGLMVAKSEAHFIPAGSSVEVIMLERLWPLL